MLANKRLAQQNMLPTDRLVAVFHIKYEQFHSTEQCNPGFNHYGAMTAVGIPYSQVFLFGDTFSVSSSYPGEI